MMRLLLLCLFIPSLAIASDPIKVTDQSVKLKSSPTDVLIPLGKYQKFSFDLQKPFKLITEPADAEVIRDSNGKDLYVLGYKDGPPEIWVYCIVDNDFYYRCLVRIDMGQPGPSPGPKPSPYLERINKAFALDAGKPAEIAALAAVYQRGAENFDAFPNLKTYWEWLAQQYSTLPQSLVLTRSALATIQEETIKKFEAEARFSVESRRACRVVLNDILSALLSLSGGVQPGPGPSPGPTPKAAAVWAIVVEETEQRTPAMASIITDVAWWESMKPKVFYRAYDKDQSEARSYASKATEKNITLPALLILEKGTGKTLDVRALPASKDEIKSLLQGIVGQ